jgi:AraC family transcriptional regulator
VLQIALAVGFENASHFSVQFKRGYGVTPLAYRLRG